MSFDNIVYEKDKAISVITLNRPDVLNAYTKQMVDEMVKALDDSALDDSIKAVIITGAGRGFCTGVDNKEPKEEKPSIRSVVRHEWRLYPVISKLWGYDKPVICAINGIAAGAGTSIAMICDIRIGSERAEFCMVWARRNMVPDNGASYLLAQLVNPAKAYELTWSGDAINATEMEKIGLISKVVPHERLLSVIAAKKSQSAD
ncbi:MAG: enoyl-CoA hydratase/isomerase family protein [Chloroflexi bacterium]|nr:enoyl-CoA hydratase/isomerase family protein [Chloroflexota bacterium]